MLLASQIAGNLKNIGVGLVKNGCGDSGVRTLKLAVSPEAVNGINLLLVCWCKFWKAKSFFNDFWMVVVKMGMAF